MIIYICDFYMQGCQGSKILMKTATTDFQYGVQAGK